MEKISLYIAGKKVDLDNNSFILFNYTMEDLSNPTIVKNSFSKQITLKGTPVNNEIFGNIYRTDRKTIFGEKNTGIFFDPLRKTPFSIYNDMGEIIESGYVKLDGVSMVAGVPEYKITLYGGLGSFFYNLTYNDNGDKKTLADLVYQHEDGRIGKIVSRKIDATAVISAWEYLDWGAHADADWDIINFAPCYNGLPDKFDANKVLCNAESYQNVVPSATIEGETYGIKTGCSTFLITMANKHTEWEMKIMSPYLQRMVVSVKAIMRAIRLPENNGGYSVEFDDTFFSNKTPVVWRGWWTLGIPAPEKRYSEDAIETLLKASLTPCDYLLGLAKMYGLVFTYDSANKKIRIIQRDTFYAEGNSVDLSERIDRSSLTITPMLVESQYLRMGGDKMVGEYAESYKQNYGKPYGCQDINTGYEFNLERKVITQDIPFQEAADVVESNYLYASYIKQIGRVYIDEFAIPLYETAEMQLYKPDSEDVTKVALQQNTTLCYLFDRERPFEDWLPKPQFHEAENKAKDGSNCLLLYNGIKSAPNVTYGYNQSYVMSNDHPDMEILNGGTPCWCFVTGHSQIVEGLPSFRRVYVDYYKNMKSDLSWGMPLERAVHGIIQDTDNPHTIYHDRWKAYLSDRYDVDTKMMKCKVNLSGLKVGQELMRNFFFYENAIWVLNKISNHSITTDDLTECEFVKVKDIKNYTEGQKL